MPGWKAAVTMAKLDKPVEVHGAEVTEAVSKVTWTANPGTRINPGEFAGVRALRAARCPETDELVMPAIQTYDNKKVVAWDAPPPTEGGEEPEHPAPAIALSPAGERRPPRRRRGVRRRRGRRGRSHDVEHRGRRSRPATTPHAGSAGPAWSSARSASAFGVGATLRARKAVTASKSGGES